MNLPGLNALAATWRILTAPGRAVIHQLNKVRAPGAPPVGPGMALGVHFLVALVGIALVAAALTSPALTAILLVLIGLWWWLDRYRPLRRPPH